MAAISKTLYQAGKQTGAQVAQNVRQFAREELGKTGESVTNQIGIRSPEIQKEGDVPEVVQKIRGEGPENIDRESIKQAETARIQALEAELMNMIKKREQAEKNYDQAVQAQMQTHNEAPEENVAPQGKIKKVLGRVKKMATNIIQGKKSQESKQGTGKG